MNLLQDFKNKSFTEALQSFFKNLNVPFNVISEYQTEPINIIGDKKCNENIKAIYPFGIVTDAIFNQEETKITQTDVENEKYEGILLFGVDVSKINPSRSDLAEITRQINRAFTKLPVVVVFKYGNQLTFANAERIDYQQQWREGEKVGKISMLKDIELEKPHAAHLKILFGSADNRTTGLQIDQRKINSFEKLYQYWQKQLSIQALNDEFYADLQSWFYYATQKIKLPYKPDYIDDKENTKNFLVRLLARTMFCWFVKEKGLIQKELLELKDWDGTMYPLTNDFDHEYFLQSNSYYRGILQNVFYNALNQKDKKSIKDFKWTKYWHQDLPINWFTEVPYLNGGIFDKLNEDNANESIEDNVIQIPNFLFYGIEINTQVTRGRGANATTSIQKVEHKGLNGILKSYKFTLDENTPFEEDIALDPEMLGLVFENLLAELDPNLEESTIKSIRKLTGSFYTPRKTIFEMVNDSLFLYLNKYLQKNHPQIPDFKKQTNQLVYYDILQENNTSFCFAIVEALDKFKMLDPACGSGAFPMGMLHRMVAILKLVDPNNEKWLALKLKNVDKAQQNEFKKVLTSHLDDYSRKLGIIRDSIYGIDIQPLAVQITKLRFFISLLIDQKTDKGITPMPNIETKIICANSLKNIQPDLFSNDAIERLIDARTRYYQPDISKEERDTISDEIIEVLDRAFPSFAYQITGKTITGQNKVLLRDWFTHGTIAAPFFNMDFFFPELKETGGFDCVIGNPPYGGIKIPDEVRTALDIESKDPYGAFIARFLNAHNKTTPLKHGGVLAYIVSDTFMTIKSHLKLRKHLMQNYVHKMLRVHPDTFRATVNTVIMIAERNTEREIDDNHICLMADLTNISIHDNYDHFVEVLNQTKGVDFESTDAIHCVSNEEYAIYYYPQALIKTNSNLPFFVASPFNFSKLRTISKPLSFFINEICGGIKSYNDKVYIRNLYGNMGYETFNEKLIAKHSLSDEEKKNGILVEDFEKQPYYIRYEKGGDTHNELGILNNYYKPVEFYFPWDKKTVKDVGKNNGLRNRHRYFSKGIGVSTVGVYAPIFRYCEFDVFFNNYNIICNYSACSK
jgi:hypothetical protein